MHSTYSTYATKKRTGFEAGPDMADVSQFPLVHDTVTIMMMKRVWGSGGRDTANAAEQCAYIFSDLTRTSKSTLSLAYHRLAAIQAPVNMMVNRAIPNEGISSGIPQGSPQGIVHGAIAILLRYSSLDTLVIIVWLIGLLIRSFLFLLYRRAAIFSICTRHPGVTDFFG